MGMRILTELAHDKVKLLEGCQKDTHGTGTMGCQGDLFIRLMSSNFAAERVNEVVPHGFLHGFWVTVPAVTSSLSPFIRRQVGKVRSEAIQIRASSPDRELLLQVLVKDR
jgi:hypothetical protein